MADTTTVHNFYGTPLADLPVAIPRGWKLENDVSAAKGLFSLPSSHAAATAINLRNGNLIFTQCDQRGIQDWAAIICEPEPDGTEVIAGEVHIKLRSAEYILASRYTARQDIFTGTPGAVFVSLLTIARREGVLPISTNYAGVDTSGASVGPLEYNGAEIYGAINQLADDSDAYWWLQPYIDPSTNSLTLQAFFKYRRTRVFPNPLVSSGSGGAFSISKVYQSAELANHVQAYGYADDIANAPFYEEYNRVSIGYYQHIATTVIQCQQENSLDGLIPVVKAALLRQSFPLLRVDGILNAAPFPRVGDVCTVLLDNYGQLITARRGGAVQMYVKESFYSPAQKSLSLWLEEVRT